MLVVVGCCLFLLVFSCLPVCDLLLAVCCLLLVVRALLVVCCYFVHGVESIQRFRRRRSDRGHLDADTDVVSIFLLQTRVAVPRLA